MWVKLAIAAVVLLWLSRRSSAATPAPAPKATVSIGDDVKVTFHEGAGVWNEPWLRAGTTSCESGVFIDGVCQTTTD